MKKPIHEGEELKKYLRDNKLGQEEFSAKLGYKTRQGLAYYFGKEIIDYEFKMKLREHGVMLFDENGKINLTNTGEETGANNKAEEPTITYGKAMDLYEETIQAQRVVINLQGKYVTAIEKENEELKQKLKGKK